MSIAETFTLMLAVVPGLTVKTSGNAARTDPDLPIMLPSRGYVCWDTVMFFAVEKTKELLTYPKDGIPMPIAAVFPSNAPVSASTANVAS